MTTPNVAFIRTEVTRLLGQYELIRDCLSGEVAVKEGGPKYLPKPDPEDKSEANKKRYLAYLVRAVFYNVARRTHMGLVGQIFMRPPEVEAPEVLAEVLKDATGAGVSFDQLAKRLCATTLAYARAGLFVDYPDTGGGVSREDITTGKYRPTVTLFGPQEVINWRVISDGAKELLALVVIAEVYPFADDGFELKQGGRLRVLRLDEKGEYVQTIWELPTPEEVTNGVYKPKKGNWFIKQTYKPTGFDGKPLREIPFSFVGSENNDSNPDNPPFYDICSLNIAHYRNSADYEEACYMTGQPTLVMNGLTDQWVDDHIKGKVRLGSRGGIPLGRDMDAKLIQATESTMLKEAIDGKEAQMIALGAKLVEPKSVQRTAFETKVDVSSANSTLVNVSLNATTALEWALKSCLIFVKSSSSEIKYKLNTDFDVAKLTPEERKQVVSEWKDGAISWQEMRNGLRAAGSATEDDAKVKAEIEAAQEKELADQIKVNNAPGAGAFGGRQ